jgi:hypothetical protein
MFRRYSPISQLPFVPRPEGAPRDLLDGQLAPEIARLAGMLGDARTLEVELVVLGAGELLGALRAVGAAGGTKGSAGKGHAGRGAGGNALGNHFGVEIRAIGPVAGAGRGWCSGW